MKALHERFATYSYRFFPTTDPTTWERMEDTTQQEEHGT
jgi:hypothetical protein